MNYYLTAGFILKQIKMTDKDTVFRTRNIRKFVIDNDILHHKFGGVYLIDFESFLKAINPSNINKQYRMPKIRTIQSATREFNTTHKVKITYHTIETCLSKYKNSITYLKHERQYLINYDELETKIIEFLKTKHKKDV